MVRRPRLPAAVTLGAIRHWYTRWPGSSDGWNKPQRQKLTVYSGRCESLIGRCWNFTKATGIEIEARYGDTAQMAAQLRKRHHRADAFIAQDAGGLGAVAKRGLFGAPRRPAPPGCRRLPGPLRRVGRGHRPSRTLVYNPDLVSAAELPKSVFDIVGPQWRGKIAIAPTNGSFQSFVTSLRVGPGRRRRPSS